MKPSSIKHCVLLTLTHGIALGIGLLLYHAPASQPAGPRESSQIPPAPGNGAAEAPSPPARARSMAEITAKASVHRLAWKELAYQNLPRPERMKAGALILQAWIREDWHAALDTVMRETPDDFALLDEFQDVFVREPEAVWRLIEGKSYGVLTKPLRDRWMTAIGRLDETQLRRLIEKLPVAGKLAASDALKMKSAMIQPFR